MRTKVAILVCGAALAAGGCKKKGTTGGGGGGWFVGTEGLMVNVDPRQVASTDYDLGATVQLDAIACRDLEEAWVAGADGTLLYTSDGGDTWVAHTLPTTAHLRAIATQDAGPVFVAGDGVVLTATPAALTGDATWRQLGDGTTPFRALAAARLGDTVLAVSADGGVWAYEDDRLVRRATIEGADAVAVSSDGATALVVGDGLARSRDGGRTWQPLDVDPSLRFTDVRLGDDGEGYAVGAGGAMARIDVDGRVLIQRLGAADLHALYMPVAGWGADAQARPEAAGYAAGDGGQIWITRDLGWTWDVGPNVGGTILAVDELGDAHR